MTNEITPKMLKHKSKVLTSYLRHYYTPHPCNYIISFIDALYHRKSLIKLSNLLINSTCS